MIMFVPIDALLYCDHELLAAWKQIHGGRREREKEKAKIVLNGIKQELEMKNYDKLHNKGFRHSQ